MVAQRRRSRPVQRQQVRCAVVCGLALLLWGLRWLWPLPWLPGWLLLLIVAWALLELAALMLFPRRWR